MAITTFTELKTAIETFRERVGATEISGNAADFVTLGEAGLNRAFRNLNRLITVDETITGTASSRELTLPADYRTALALRLTTYGAYGRLKRHSVSTLPYQVNNQPPEGWAPVGAKIHLDAPCDQAHTFQLIYRAKFDLAATTTNWLLDEHPDVYLNACLLWSGLLLMADDVTVYKGLMDQAIRAIKAEDEMNARGTMSVDPALVRSGGYNIYSDVN